MANRVSILRPAAVLLAVGASLGAVALPLWLWRRKRKQICVVQLQELPADQVPHFLKPEFYFDFSEHAFEHADLLLNAASVVDVVGSIHIYAVNWLEQKGTAHLSSSSREIPPGVKVVGDAPSISHEEKCICMPDVIVGNVDGTPSKYGLHVCSGCAILGGTFDLRSGSVWLAEDVVVEPGVHISGPAIIGKGTALRKGAYIRGDAIVGRRAVLRGEVKNTVIMDQAELCHPGYAGDSIIGYKGHFGCQAVTANLGLFGTEISITVPSRTGDVNALMKLGLGKRKIGAVLGDSTQLGCNTVAEPGTFMGPRTHVYPLTRICGGLYGPDEIIKNKPSDKGVVIRQKLLMQKPHT